MADRFLHGVEVVEVSSGSRPIESVGSSVIGIVGTAPNATPDVKAAATIGTAAANTGLTFTAKLAGAAGNDISIQLVDPASNSASLAITVTDQAISVALATNASGEITTTASALKTAIEGNSGANALVAITAVAGSSGAGVLSAVAKTNLTGGVDEPFPYHTPFLIAASRAEAARLGTTGSLPDAIDSILDQAGALIIFVRVPEGEDETATLANVVGGVNSITGQYEGVHALLGAESTLGFAPRILIAPGFTHQRPDDDANPVVAELIPIAERLRAVILMDGPNTTDADAITAAGDFDSARVMLKDPWDKKMGVGGQIVTVPPSAALAGSMAALDNERGWWNSPSNIPINGVVGTSRPVDFALGDANARANLLNEKNVSTTIRHNGYRHWGNRSLASDPKWQFLCVRRTADIINDSILRAHLWAVDRGITRTYIDDVTESVNAYLRTLKSMGAILGGECWADRDLNTPENIALGKVYFDVTFTPTYPAEHITFRSQLTNRFITDLF